MRLYSQGQGVYEDRRQVASLLGLPEEKVRVIQVANGGGFGGKEDITVQGHAALFALLLQKPVRVRLSRPESIRMHPKRHPLVMEYALGCDRDGRLTALRARIVGDTGAYASVGDQGAGAGRRPRHRRLPRAGRRHRGQDRLYQQPALRRHARLRRQPGDLRHGELHRHALRAGRLRPLAVPLRQRPGPRGA